MDSFFGLPERGKFATEPVRRTFGEASDAWTVYVMLPSAESRLQIGEFHLLLYEEVNHKKWRPVQVLLPEVIVWSFALRLEHLVVRITPTIKHSVRFQQEGAIE